ncbi:ParM/StbA family protein [Clostridium felsineum]|uniref:ParM/StbA family protein n=1 Tax=Clostridium felsineum TaxID=36839 RepID=UPI00214DAEF5|nr:ParM/StbA family protein [Clostridium felsineum]MCR3758904.1 ParM/StbA family protein [Clostridium felsineum]
MSKLIISIDPGKYLTKSIALKDNEEITDVDFLKDKRIFFRSKMYDLEDGDVELQGKSYLTEYDGRKIIIGDQGDVDGSEETNKATLLHKLCVYTAITQCIVPKEKIDVYMVLSCPLNLLKSKEYKDEYKEFIGNGGKEINILVNNENYIFTIKSITIKSEGSGILYLDKEKFSNCEVALIDIGGLNMQFCKYTNGFAVPESRFTEMTGGNKLVQDIKEALEITLRGKPISFEQSEQALKDKVLRINNSDVDESREIIKNKIQRYIKNDIVRNITKRRNSLELMQPIIVGGTCLNIKEELKSAIENIEIQNDPQWASVEGLFNIAYLKYRTKD